MKRTTLRQERFIKELKTSKTATEAAIKAGYSPVRARNTAYEIRKKIARYGETGLDTLDKLAREGKVELAQVQAAKTLVETAYGKPRSNDEKYVQPTINISFNKVGDGVAERGSVQIEATALRSK